MRIVDGNHGRERFRELDGDAVAVAQQGRMGDAIELIAEGLIELGHAMAQGGDPQRRDGVEITSAVDGDQLASLAPLHDHRGVVGVARHLGEAVPDHGRVALHPVVHDSSSDLGDGHPSRHSVSHRVGVISTRSRRPHVGQKRGGSSVRRHCGSEQSGRPHEGQCIAVDIRSPSTAPRSACGGRRASAGRPGASAPAS